MIVIIILSLTVASLIALSIITKWYLFEKTFIKGWQSVIPIYSDIRLFSAVWNPVWYALYILLAIGIVALEYTLFIASMPYLIPAISLALLWTALIALTVKFNLKVAYSYGKASGFAVGLTLLPAVFYPMLAFDRSVYIGK